MDKGQAEPLLPTQISKKDPYRFVILAIFCLATLIISLSFFGFSSVATNIQEVGFFKLSSTVSRLCKSISTTWATWLPTLWLAFRYPTY